MTQDAFANAPAGEQTVDAVVIGAGFGGLYSLYRIRELGVSVKLLEKGGDVGGTWYWNRYPGCRCDVESVDYAYSFSKAIEMEWEWNFRFAEREEIQNYAKFVASRLGLYEDIQFGTEVRSATFDEHGNTWQVETAAGERFVCRFLVLATGSLSSVNRPDFPGIDDFAGPIYHTAEWPAETVDFADANIGVIGTGSSGIQVIPKLAAEAKHLTVFQRTANYSLPAQNRPLDDDTKEAIRRDESDRRKLSMESVSGIPQTHPDVNPTQSALEVDEDARADAFEAAWDTGGAPGVLNTFNDLLTDEKANETAAEFVRAKIRAIVNDPEKARRLTPRNHPIGSKRICVDTDYFETFNRDNVDIVDLRETPIVAVEDHAIRTTGGREQIDVLVCATGFDAFTGAIRAIDVVGRNGVRLRDKWSERIQAYLGISVSGFPNLFLVGGPGSPSVLSNVILSLEVHGNWISNCIEYLDKHAIATIEAELDAEEQWVETVSGLVEGSVLLQADSWFLGANIPGKPRQFIPYAGGFSAYNAILKELEEDGYPGFKLAEATPLSLGAQV